ncbi:MAG: hypothetical protein JNL40_16100 [Cyclobacteriaceae bacterium]|nr:hypothetical protein [Cyclobacteriaceae bacterium]
MKALISILMAFVVIWSASCSSKTHASSADKKKANKYNSIQYGNQKKKH